MKYCQNCGSENEVNNRFCRSCGADLNVNPNQTAPVDTNLRSSNQYQRPAVSNSGQIILSIVNLVLCCLPLGIVGLIYSIMAGNAATQEEAESKLRTAKTCNLIGFICGFVVIAIYIIITVIAVMNNDTY